MKGVQMNNNLINSLSIDSEFKNLIAPLTSEEYEQLEENIKREGCLEPLIIWKDIIIDGHNRYSICQKHKISFHTKNTHFKNREDVISWICSNQLSKHNISEETKKYLIGKKFENEKIICAKNITSVRSNNFTAYEIGKEYNISYNTVYKYGIYSKAMDILQKKCPDIAHKILYGKIKISHDNLLHLSKLSKSELQSLLNYITDKVEGQIRYSDIRHELQWKPFHKNSQKEVTVLQSNIPIKQLPKYDPDAEISSLSLTIPSWISSITRTTINTAFNNTSSIARKKLLTQLSNLKTSIEELIILTKEDL